VKIVSRCHRLQEQLLPTDEDEWRQGHYGVVMWSNAGALSLWYWRFAETITGDVKTSAVRFTFPDENNNH